MTSYLGKIYEINFYNKESNVISVGHDNPQGIVYDSENNIIFSTEHGPQGGDELNKISKSLIKQNQNVIYPILHLGY